jgi:murein DD-endopeptidase MepM/ murein hydrolase activator NlpD
VLTSTQAISETPEPMLTPEPSETTESPVSPILTTTIVSTTTIEPMSVPAPNSALEFMPTVQLTLSSVIFVENVGQLDDDVRFQVRGALGGGVWLAQDGIWLTLVEPPSEQPGLSAELVGATQSSLARGLNLKLSFVDSNPSPQLEPFNRLDTHVSYFSGNDPASWHARVPVWSGVRVRDLYPGVDLELTSERGHYVQRLVVHPEADLSTLRLRVDGADSLGLEPLPIVDGESGEERDVSEFASPPGSEDPATVRYYLRLTTALGEFSLPLFQVVTTDGSPPSLPTALVPHIAEGSNVVEFPVLLPQPDEPDRRRVVAPSHTSPDEPAHLLYATFVGQGGSDASYGIAVDETGSAYVTGRAFFPAFPLEAGVFDPASRGNYDVSVTKLKDNGTEMAFTAFLGGSGDESGYAIAVDRLGSAYVTGVTDSSDLPTTTNSFDTDADGELDAFVVKVDAAGTGLAYTTFLGGSEDDWGRAIAVDGAGNALVTGSTLSSDFPATTGAADTIGDSQDAFVVKVNAIGSGLVYATFLGGSGIDQGNAIAVDEAGQAYVAGSTQSADLPVTAGAFDDGYNGDYDAFVARVNVDGTDLPYVSFLGGSAADLGNGIAVDGSGRVTIVGSTRSADFPTTAWGFDTSHGGGYDAFVVQIEAGGSELGYASFLGGSSDDWGQAIAVDDMGYAYVTGSTQAFDVPEGGRVFDSSHNGDLDGFVVRVNELGTGLAYATVLGGSSQDHAWDIAVDQVGSAYVAGMSASVDFAQGEQESTPGDVASVPLRPAGVWDGFATKLVVGTPFLDLPVSYSNFAEAALGNVADQGPGRVNSWFDHYTPNHVRNQRMVRWDGTTARLTASSPPLIGESWYDGHGGTDFRRDERNEPIYAAAPGKVIDTFSTCSVGDPSCGGHFGNRVWIDHGNGYATVYAHLNTVQVDTGMVIADPASQPLGTMGNTGRSLGTHLHLGLYFDHNADGQWTQDEAVDPYGWAGSGKDPWGGLSRYLWTHPLWSRQVVGNGGGRLTNPSGLVTATVPTAAFEIPAQVELWDVPAETLERGQLATSSTLWRSTGREFRLMAHQPATEVAIALSRPITLTVAFRVEDLVRLDPSQLAIRHWDEERKAWVTLPTTVNKAQNLAIAQTTELGRFALHAPLLYAADALEPDDHYASALPIATDGIAVRRGFDIAEDKDWVRVDVEAGGIYVAQTSNLADGVGTTLQLRDPNTLALRASGVRPGGGAAAYLKWQVLQDGAYLLQINRLGGGAYGDDATYALRVKQVFLPEKVAIAGPTIGGVEQSYAFTATVAPDTATLPVTYTWQAEDTPSTSSSGDTAGTFTFTWSTTGTHRVVVTATNEAGSVTGTHSIVIHGQLAANFVAFPSSGTAPLKVSFENRSDGYYTDSLWDFGDGKISQAEAPSHTYKTPGVYTVTLTIGGPGGSDTKTRMAYIEVKSVPTPAGGDYIIYLPFISRNYR